MAWLFRRKKADPKMTKPDASKGSDPVAEGPKKAASETDELNASSDRIRETARWIVATFGAVASALLVGIQLSDIGQLEDDARIIATLAVFGALAAVIMIVALGSVVLARGRVPLSELSSSGNRRKYKRLREELNRNRSLYGKYGSVAGLVDRVEAEWEKQLRSWDAMHGSKDPDQREQARREFEETKKVMPELNMLSRRLLSFARAEDIRLTFEYVRNGIIVLAVVVAAGAAAFAFVNDAPDPDEDPAISQRPVAASLSLTPAGEDKMGSILGDECPLRRVPVAVLASSEEGWEAVSIPAEGCESARLTIEPEDGELEALAAVSLTPPPTDDEDLEPPPGG